MQYSDEGEEWCTAWCELWIVKKFEMHITEDLTRCKTGTVSCIP